MITLEMTSGERLFVQHLLDQQTGTYLELKEVWRLEDKLDISDEDKRKIGWSEDVSDGRSAITVKDETVPLTFSLEDQDAKKLKSMFLGFTRWPKHPSVRSLGSKLEDLTVN